MLTALEALCRANDADLKSIDAEISDLVNTRLRLYHQQTSVNNERSRLRQLTHTTAEKEQLEKLDATAEEIKSRLRDLDEKQRRLFGERISVSLERTKLSTEIGSRRKELNGQKQQTADKYNRFVIRDPSSNTISSNTATTSTSITSNSATTVDQSSSVDNNNDRSVSSYKFSSAPPTPPQSNYSPSESSSSPGSLYTTLSSIPIDHADERQRDEMEHYQSFLNQPEYYSTFHRQIGRSISPFTAMTRK